MDPTRSCVHCFWDQLSFQSLSPAQTSLQGGGHCTRPERTGPQGRQSSCISRCPFSRKRPCQCSEHLPSCGLAAAVLLLSPFPGWRPASEPPEPPGAGLESADLLGALGPARLLALTWKVRTGVPDRADGHWACLESAGQALPCATCSQRPSCALVPRPGQPLWGQEEACGLVLCRFGGLVFEREVSAQLAWAFTDST